MSRRRHRKPLLLRPVPLFLLLAVCGTILYTTWPFGNRERSNTALMSEREPAVVEPGIKPATPDAPAPAVPGPSAFAPNPSLAAAGKVALPAPPTSQPTQTRPAPVDPTQAENDFQAGMAAKEKEPVKARELLNRALQSGLTPAQLETARQTLTELANATIFSARALQGDPLVDSHSIVVGDTLGKLAKASQVSEDLLAEINGIRQKHLIRLGMRIKLVRGPFHAVIVKSEHQMHLFAGDTYVRSYPVALGMDGRTPTGKWRVSNHQSNPAWTDPRTGKRWHPDDPANPIGEYWIGLECVEGPCQGAFGYGIHGTNEPESIGKDVSLGCVRLAAADIDFTYKLLLPGLSYVTIAE